MNLNKYLKWFDNKFRSLTRPKQIAILVILTHTLTLLALLMHHAITQKPKPSKPILVRTVTPTAPSPLLATTTTPPKKSATPPPAPAQPKPKPKASPKQPSPAHQKKPSPPSPPPPPPAPAPSRAVLSVPAPIQFKPLPLSLPQKTTSLKEPSYGEYLIGYLQQMLHLPEHGDVKINIEIDRFGNLIACDILEAKSQKNGTYIKNQLPQLTFPCLNDFGILETTHNFTITFKNVETH